MKPNFKAAKSLLLPIVGMGMVVGGLFSFLTGLSPLIAVPLFMLIAWGGPQLATKSGFRKMMNEAAKRDVS